MNENEADLLTRDLEKFNIISGQIESDLDGLNID